VRPRRRVPRGLEDGVGANIGGAIWMSTVTDTQRFTKIPPMVTRSLVSVVDDDESVRESLPDLVREFGFVAKVFSAAEEFLASDCVGQTGCLILDVAMPGMTGPDLQQELRLRRQEIPIVFITAHGDEVVRPRLLGQGAVECLLKPFSDTALLEALKAAFRVG
jgi:FixJ family two-component response regulator